MNTILTASFLALTTERIVAALTAPVRLRWPDLNLWWIIYPSWVLGGAIAYFAQINLLAELVPQLDPLLGRLLTAVIVGGGANLLHDFFSNMPTTRITASSSAGSVMTATVATAEPQKITEQDLPLPPGRSREWPPRVPPDREIQPRR